MGLFSKDFLLELLNGILLINQAIIYKDIFYCYNAVFNVSAGRIAAFILSTGGTSPVL